jgi:hypothetical protein
VRASQKGDAAAGARASWLLVQQLVAQLHLEISIKH